MEENLDISKLSDPEVVLNEFPQCQHPVSNPFTITVLGKEITLQKSIACKTCLEIYLNKFSILCIVCQNPILPLDHVTGQSTFNSGGAERSGRAHARCAPVGCFEGIWGEGVIVPLKSS